MNDLPYNGMLENVPNDPIKAKNYTEILSRWKEQQRVFMGDGRQSPADFWAWDKNVQKLLTPAELAFFLEPHIKNANPDDVVIAEVNRINHLTKILVHRQGIKTTNGFNG
jgi:hypothetical protein